MLHLEVHSLQFRQAVAFFCSDGAAALVLVSGAIAVKHGLKVIAKIKGYADAAQVIKWNLFMPMILLDYSSRCCNWAGT